MKEKIRVDIEMVHALKAALSAINNPSLDDIQFYKNGKPIKMLNVSEFRSIGMANTDYVMMEFWKKRRKVG